MKLWVTEIAAVDPQDRILKLWAGPHVPGLTMRDAEKYCQLNGLGYCVVLGELVEERDDDAVLNQDIIRSN